MNDILGGIYWFISFTKAPSPESPPAFILHFLHNHQWQKDTNDTAGASVASWSSIVTDVNKTSECHSCVWRANQNSSALQLRKSPWGVRTNCSGYQVTWKHKHNIWTETCKISWVGGDSSACQLGTLSVGKQLNFAFLQEVNQTTYLLVP